jgi:hypothetical protein
MGSGDTDRLLAFYRGFEPDGAGRLISEVWAFSFDELEFHHDFIQWIFPLAQPSRFNPSAPLITAYDCYAFDTDRDLRRRAMRSLDLMLAFYGFERAEADIVPGSNFTERCNNWAWPKDHNHLRLSRMVQSLRLMTFNTEALCLRRALLRVADTLGPERIGPTTVQHWRKLLVPEPFLDRLPAVSGNGN